MCSSSSPPAGQPTTSTAYNTNIPEYAKPYVTNMLEATQQQLFNVDADKGITGFKGYKPYSTDMNNYFAGFSPMQQQAQQATANMQMPDQYGQASTLAGASGVGSIAAGQQYGQQATDPNAVGRYMNPYLQNALNPAMQLLNQQYGIAGQQQRGGATKSGAFGGNRETLANSLNQQNQMLAQNQLVGNAYNKAYDTANTNMQTAASQALQGYGQANTAAGTLANIGGQDLAARQSIANAQNTMGAQQQALEQQKINQSIQNYATDQQYPMMQLGMMSNMLRGLPMQSTTTQSYQAQPTTSQQVIGAAGALGSTYQALARPNKEGGVIKGLAHGGSVNSYAVGGEIKQQLSMMSEEQLQHVIQTSPSNEIRSMAGQILAEHKMAEQMTKNPEAGQGLMAANTGDTFDGMAGGGIIAFTKGGGTPSPIDDVPRLTDEELAARMEAPVAPGLPATPVQKPAQIGGLDLESNLRGIEQARTSRGIGAPRQAEKESIEKQMAGLADKENRQMWLEAAKGFGRFGTTAGGPLKGVLEAVKEGAPELVALQDKHDKIRQNYATIQANIAEADRLDKLGMFDKAEAIRENALKMKGENDRADAANARALKVAEIGLEGHKYTADKHDATQRAVAGMKAGKEKIDEIAFAAAAKNVAAEMSIAEGKPVSPRDPRVLEEAYKRLAGIKGLAGQKLESQEDFKGKTQLEKALTDDKPYQTIRFQLSQAKEGSPKFAELQAKEKRMKQEIMDRLSKTTPASKKEPGIDGDKAEKRPPLSNFER